MGAEDARRGDEVLPESNSTVPVFGCVIYVSTQPNGEVRGRVANLAGIEATGSSERDVLSQIVPAFQERIRELMQHGKAIPWTHPQLVAEADEAERFVPVHL